MESNLAGNDRQKEKRRGGGKQGRQAAGRSRIVSFPRFITPAVSRPRDGCGPRAGITLFEVVLALAIFLGALASITQILRNGSQANIQARRASEAALRCEAQLNEIVAGSLPLETVSGAKFEDNPNWTWSLVISDTEIPDLLEIQVTVEHLRSDDAVDSSFQLSRLMRDPQVFIDAAAPASTSSTGGTL